MNRIHSTGALATLLLACGSEPTPATGPDGGADSSLPDAIADAAPDIGAEGDSQPGTDAGFPYPPAIWSRALDHGGYSKLFGEAILNAIGSTKLPCLTTGEGPTWGGEAAVGFDIGTGARASAGIFRERLAKDGKPCGSLSEPEVLTIADHVPSTRLLDVNPIPLGVAFTRASNDQADAYLIRTGVVSGGVQLSLKGTGVKPRAHFVYGQNVVAGVADSTTGPATTFGPMSAVPPGSMAFVEASGAKRALGGLPPVIAVDVLSGGSGQGLPYYFVGRLAGPSFDFITPNPPDGQINGSGFFMASMTVDNGGFVLTDWVKLFGGVPQEAVGTTDHPGAGARYANGIFTAVFEGTMTIGGKTLTAPSNAPAIAVAFLTLGSSGPVATAAFAFPKGPASKGKLSRPRVVKLDADKYVLADTVWDTIDVGGTIVSAKNGADVSLVGFNGLGQVQWSRVYGGAGDDESYEITTPVLSNVILWTGHSSASIDFGNGPLTTTAVDGEAWATRIDL